METTDFGKVKFQNAFLFYDIMYTLYKGVIKSSSVCKLNSYESIKRYYDSLNELYNLIEPFLVEDNVEIRLKNAVANVCKHLRDLNPDIKNVELSNILKIPLKLIKDIEQLHGGETTGVQDYFDVIEVRMRQAKKYVAAPGALVPHTRVIKKMLDEVKRMIAGGMKRNKLTVPIHTGNPGTSITRGYS